MGIKNGYPIVISTAVRRLPLGAKLECKCEPLLAAVRNRIAIVGEAGTAPVVPECITLPDVAQDRGQAIHKG